MAKQLKNLPKQTLQAIGQSRGIATTGSKEKIIEKLSAHKGPFGINTDLSQEEQVLSLIGVSNFQIEKYLALPSGDINNTRVQLLEKLLKQNLTKKSKRIVDLSTYPLRTIQKIAGNKILPKAGLIRQIVELVNTPPEYIKLLQEQLEGLGFRLVTEPKTRVPKPLTKVPFTPIGARNAISNKEDPTKIGIDILRSIILDYIIFPRDLTNSQIRDIILEAVIHPPRKEWPRVKEILENRSFKDLQELAGFWGFENLNPTQLEFFFSRGYVEGAEKTEWNLSEASESFLDILGKRYGEDLEKNLSKTAKKEKEWLRTLFEWDQLEIEDLISVAEAEGISISYPNGAKTFWKNAFDYLTVDTNDSFSWDERPELTQENLQKYSDFALIEWFPSAPYGRKRLLKKFIEYWEKKHWFWNDGRFFYGNWSKAKEKEEPNWSNLDYDELFDSVVWLNDQLILRSNVLTEICRRINELDPEESGLIPRDDIPVELRNLFAELILVGALAGGAPAEGRWPTEPRKPDADLLEAGFARVEAKVQAFDEELLVQFPMMKLRTLEKMDETLATFLNFEPDWSWVETGVFYLSLYFGNELVEQNFVLSRS